MRIVRIAGLAPIVPSLCLWGAHPAVAQTVSATPPPAVSADVLALDPPPEVPRLRAWVWSLPGGPETSDVIDQVRAYLKPPSAKAAALVREGWAEIHRRDFPRAIARLDEAIRLDPSFAPAYVARGVARHDLGDLVGARAEYDHAIRLDPSDSSPYHYRGLAHLHGKEYWAAIDAFSETIAAFPDRPEPYIGRANAWLALRDARAARDDAARALALVETSPEAMQIWLTSLEHLGKHADLLTILDAKIQSDPSDPADHIRRAMLLATSPDAHVRNPEAALASARHAEAIGHGRSRAALRALAVAHASAGDYPMAVRCAFLAAFRETPNRDLGTDLVYLATFLARRPYRTTPWDDERPDRQMRRLVAGAGISDRRGYYVTLDLDRGFTLRAAIRPPLAMPMVVVRWNPKGLREFREWVRSPENLANAPAPMRR